MKHLITLFLSASIGFLAVQTAPAATGNSGNNPMFLVVQASSNGFVPEALGQDTIDLGVDIGADGEYDYWLSEDRTFNAEINADAFSINERSWRNIVINLDQYPAGPATIQIVDRSEDHHIAVNSIRMNNADGFIVENPVPNGNFDEPELEGWTIIEGDSPVEELQILNPDGFLVPNGEGYFTTTDITSSFLENTAVIESASFELQPMSSFIYTQFAGPASARFDQEFAWESENQVYVFLDLETQAEDGLPLDPDGEFNEEDDIAVRGFLFDNAQPDLTRVPLHAYVINTSGLEGLRAKLVIVDNDAFAAIGADSIRMNWDHHIIRNGGFEEGFSGGFPQDFPLREVNGGQIPLPTALQDHPDNRLPGWEMLTRPLADEEAQFTLFGWPGVAWSRSGRSWIGSGSLPGVTAQRPELVGLELRSDEFEIAPIPPANESVFLAFNNQHITSRFDADGQEKTVRVEIDQNNSGTFGDEGDVVLYQHSQGSAWHREQFVESALNAWAYPEYRFYFAPEYQGQTARIVLTDSVTGEGGWLSVDDFFIWDGAQAQLAFDNADFENGDLTNWNETLEGGETWLTGTPEAVEQELVSELIGSGHNTFVDGMFAASTRENERTGTLISEPFMIPQGVTSVHDWHLF